MRLNVESLKNGRTWANSSKSTRTDLLTVSLIWEIMNNSSRLRIEFHPPSPKPSTATWKCSGQMRHSKMRPNQTLILNLEKMILIVITCSFSMKASRTSATTSLVSSDIGTKRICTLLSAIKSWLTDAFIQGPSRRLWKTCAKNHIHSQKSVSNTCSETLTFHFSWRARWCIALKTSITQDAWKWR